MFRDICHSFKSHSCSRTRCDFMYCRCNINGVFGNYDSEKSKESAILKQAPRFCGSNTWSKIKTLQYSWSINWSNETNCSFISIIMPWLFTPWSKSSKSFLLKFVIFLRFFILSIVIVCWKLILLCLYKFFLFRRWI